MDSYNSYFDYWKATSDNICDCCKNAVYFKCEAEDCEYYYKLTDDEIKAKNYSNLYHITWDCTNTDNFEKAFSVLLFDAIIFYAYEKNEIDDFAEKS